MKKMRGKRSLNCSVATAKPENPDRKLGVLYIFMFSMEIIILIIIAIIIVTSINTLRSGAFAPSDEWYKTQYNWNTVSAYFKKMLDEKSSLLNEAEKRLFYGNQIMKIDTFISLQKKSPSENKFQRWIIDEGDRILSQIDESQIQGKNAKKACLFSAIIGQIVFASENNHLLGAKQKIHPPIEKFFYYAYEETLKKFNLSPYNCISDIQ
ncbi:hypothetical protein HOG48_00570 [Candidatus Peregrinibacteria bacterium]|nr:hypothetical protein [Candidatus Peregrinibacteria bacterium]